MECPYCGAELVYNDSYGTKDYIIYGDLNGIMGNIYYCPNREQFEDENEAIEYIRNYYEYKDEDEVLIEKYLDEFGLEDIEEVCCYSSVFNGNFYTDKSDNLHEGYPC